MTGEGRSGDSRDVDSSGVYFISVEDFESRPAKESKDDEKNDRENSEESDPAPEP